MRALYAIVADGPHGWGGVVIIEPNGPDDQVVTFHPAPPPPAMPATPSWGEAVGQQGAGQALASERYGPLVWHHVPADVVDVVGFALAQDVRQGPG